MTVYTSVHDAITNERASAQAASTIELLSLPQRQRWWPPTMQHARTARQRAAATALAISFRSLCDWECETGRAFVCDV